ncbi:MAG TPA: energy transducer TonB [Thermoanaerobaculia bacterium]|nr:energy transducer TonB [Thermoanaerobaculia bacterium]
MGAKTRKPGGRPWRYLLALLAILLLLGDRASAPVPRPAPPPSRPAPPWLPVHSERLALLGHQPVYAVCFHGVPPRALVHPSLDLPLGHPLRRLGGIVIAHCLIDPQGWVVQAQILAGPDRPVLREALVRALARWRFEPARRPNGQPAAVHYAVSLRVEPGS